MSDSERLAAIRQREQQASRGPWLWHWRDDPDAPGSVAMRDQNYAIAMCPRYGKSDFAANAEFIANARSDVPWLLSEHDRLLARVGELEAEKAELVKRLHIETGIWMGED